MKNKLRGLAKNLRKRATNVENYLWMFLRNRQIEGIKFRRQEPIGIYIIDFVSYDKKLIVEVDGGQHNLVKEKDKERDEWLQRQGYEVLRFWDHEVLINKEAVLEVIRKKILSPHQTSPTRGEEKH